MSYEEIDRAVYGNDVFTNGAEGRYAKPKLVSEKKKRAPKINDTGEEQPYENGYMDESVKTKKKNRKVHENGEDDGEVIPSNEGEVVVKPKKKRAPKIESNNENIDPIPTEEEEPIKKKKSKAPKATTVTEENSIINESDPATAVTTTKVKKPKKHKTPKATTETVDDVEITTMNEYSMNSEFNGTYDSTAGDISYDVSSPAEVYPSENEQIVTAPERSEYETAILDAYKDLASKVNFTQYVGNDQWSIAHLPKAARSEPKSRIRKILPGGKDEKTNQKSGFFNRLRTGVNTLVRDENNLLFGERSPYGMVYYDDEEDDDIDTDDLHRYAQKLRELEDTDREVNPEFLVLRDGKTVYAVSEADADGKLTYATRKPIYDRFSDQTPDDDSTEKKKFLSRLKNPFNRNKDKDGKNSGNSPKLSSGTPDSTRKRTNRKAANKNSTDDDMATSVNNEPLVN